MAAMAGTGTLLF